MARFGLPVEVFQTKDKLNFTINGIIRKKVQQSYIIGLDVVEEIITKKIPNFELFFSLTDIQAVADMTKSIMMPQFWIAVNKLLQRQLSNKQEEITLTRKGDLDPKAALTKFAAFVIYSAYNLAVDSKLQNILPSTLRRGSRSASAVLKIKPTKPKSRSAASKGILPVDVTATDFDPFAADESIDNAFGDMSVLDNLQTLIDNMMEMFMTKEDQDVDPVICEPLNRSVYGIDDGGKPDPPLHPNCRCILVPVESKVSEFFSS